MTYCEKLKQVLNVLKIKMQADLITNMQNFLKIMQ